MAVDLYDAINEDGLFNVQGKSFFAQQTINTARATTVPAEIDDAVESFQLLPVDAELTQAASNLGRASVSARNAFAGEVTTLQQFTSSLLIEMIDADNPQPNKSLNTAMIELIVQMEASSDSVNASTVTVSVSADAGNTGDGVIIHSTKRGDGLAQENMIAEDVEVVATSDGLAAALQFNGEASVQSLTAEWPKGSGSKTSITAIAAGSGLVLNGNMENENDLADAPDNWIVSVGTVGTTLKMTNVEVQTLTVTGTPTTGIYYWSISHGGVTKTTGALAYNASGSILQSAIRALPGFKNVTVSSSGTTPDFTHTVTFTGAGGNLNQHTIIEHTDSGTYTPATTVAGSANVFAGGKAVELDSDGAELTTLNQRLSNLEPETAYAMSLWALADVVPAAGVITINLVDGIGGTVIQDKQSVDNSFTFNAADLLTTWQHLDDLVSGEIVFRTPTVVPDIVYLRIRISTAVSAGTSVFIDHVDLTKMTALYAGGPLAAVFSGATAFKKQDAWTVTTTNDRDGAIQEWYNRNFNMAQLGLLLPSDSGGSETIPDTVVG